MRPSCALRARAPIAIPARRIGVVSEGTSKRPDGAGRDLAWRRQSSPKKESRSMRSIRAVVPLALALGVVAAAPGAAGAKAPPKAKASGSDVVAVTYPSLVRVRIARTERALERATRKVEH